MVARKSEYKIKAGDVIQFDDDLWYVTKADYRRVGEGYGDPLGSIDDVDALKLFLLRVNEEGDLG